MDEDTSSYFYNASLEVTDEYISPARVYFTKRIIEVMNGLERWKTSTITSIIMYYYAVIM